jgi:hypothetical protein
MLDRPVNHVDALALVPVNKHSHARFPNLQHRRNLSQKNRDDNEEIHGFYVLLHGKSNLNMLACGY